MGLQTRSCQGLWPVHCGELEATICG